MVIEVYVIDKRGGGVGLFILGVFIVIVLFGVIV